jgi:hypothetical protein
MRLSLQDIHGRARGDVQLGVVVATPGKIGHAVRHLHGSWHFNLGQVPRASPMSFGINGHQYFSIAAGTDLFVFGLP